MKFIINSIPPIKKADIKLDGLTVLCGESGTGKTVAATVIYGFLYQWHGLLHNVLRPQVEEKLRDGDIDLQEMFGGKLLDGYYDKIAKAYKGTLADVLAASDKRIAGASVKFRPAQKADISGSTYHRLVNNSLTIYKEAGDTRLSALYDTDACAAKALAFFITDAIADIVFVPHLPSVHMSSAERTGAVVFADELACARGKILEFVNLNPTAGLRMLSERAVTSYPIPVTHGVDFVREFNSLGKLTGELAEKHPEILKEFHELLGGSFGVRNDRLVFADSNGNALTMNEASGKARALADIGVYLHTKAKVGDVLIIDEPERSLGEKDQKRFADLLKKLVEAGVKVLLATNSKPFIDAADTKVYLGD